jgi:hypothetical protein
MSNNPHDAGIPVLTEIIPSTSPDAAPPAMAAPPVTDPVQAAPAELEHTMAVAVPLDEERWERMEREVSERVLNEVMARIDFVLENRVRDSLADVLQTAIDGLATEIRAGLQHSIRDVVTRAVKQEISKLQSTKK